MPQHGQVAISWFVRICKMLAELLCSVGFGPTCYQILNLYTHVLAFGALQPILVIRLTRKLASFVLCVCVVWVFVCVVGSLLDASKLQVPRPDPGTLYVYICVVIYIYRER